MGHGKKSLINGLCDEFKMKIAAIRILVAVVVDFAAAFSICHNIHL